MSDYCAPPIQNHPTPHIQNHPRLTVFFTVIFLFDLYNYILIAKYTIGICLSSCTRFSILIGVKWNKWKYFGPQTKSTCHTFFFCSDWREGKCKLHGTFVFHNHKHSNSLQFNSNISSLYYCITHFFLYKNQRHTQGPSKPANDGAIKFWL